MRSTRTRIAAAVVVAAISAALLAGCSSKFTEPFKDAPRSGHDNGSPMDVIRMSDGFSNIGAKCDGPNRVYVAYHGDSAYASVFVIANDPRCK